MSDLRFDHIGVVVATLEEGRAFFTAALGVSAWTAEVDDPGLGVAVQFGRDRSGVVYELIAPRGDASPVSGALRAGRNVLNQVAYRTASLRDGAAALVALGCRETGPAQPAVAYGGAAVQFFMSPLRFVIELIEAPQFEHRWTGTSESPVLPTD